MLEDMHARASRAGFTLIEILVVIVVIAVLASLVAPNVFTHVGEAKNVTARSQIEMLGAALTPTGSTTGGIRPPLRGSPPCGRHPRRIRARRAGRAPTSVRKSRSTRGAGRMRTHAPESTTPRATISCRWVPMGSPAGVAKPATS